VDVPTAADGVPVTGPGTGAHAAQPVITPAGRRARRAAVALVAVIGLVAAYYVGLYFYVDRSIDRVPALSTAAPEILAPQLQTGTTSYLVVGTGLPGQEGPNAVSALLAHVSGNGSRAVLVSFPPTALVDTPACRRPDGSLREPVTEAFADGLLRGGPSCLVRSVQQLSGLRVDHYLAVDLAELPAMVDALAGVSVCLPQAVDATTSGLALPAGESLLDGDDVAAYLSPGTDPVDPTGGAAAQREQMVLTATLRAALTGSTLADPVELTRFLGRASGAITVDEGTSLADVRSLGSTLGDLTGDAVQRTGIPVAQLDYVPPVGAAIESAASDVDPDAPVDADPAVTDPTQAAPPPPSFVRIDAAVTRQLFDGIIKEGELVAPSVAEAAIGSEAPAAPTPAPAPSADCG
jgi:LCP family protein required for cell wall assembly